MKKAVIAVLLFVGVFSLHAAAAPKGSSKLLPNTVRGIQPGRPLNPVLGTSVSKNRVPLGLRRAYQDPTHESLADVRKRMAQLPSTPDTSLPPVPPRRPSKAGVKKAGSVVAVAPAQSYYEEPVSSVSKSKKSKDKVFTPEDGNQYLVPVVHAQPASVIRSKKTTGQDARARRPEADNDDDYEEDIFDDVERLIAEANLYDNEF